MPTWWEVLLFGADPTKWSTFAHRVTGWRYYSLPDVEFLPGVPKARRPIRDLVDVVWPASMIGLSTPANDWSKVPSTGSPVGTPMQAGTSQRRHLTYGYAEWGQQSFASIPRPALGWYWTTGHPNPTWDRHCIISDPTDDSVHEFIQFDPSAPALLPPMPNQALGWGRWKSGVCVDGVACTGTGFPMHPFIWGPFSHHDAHELAIVLPDYKGDDGLLSDPEGPRGGMRLVLRRDSDSHRRMVALGGECAILAEALCVFGCLVIDRSGYADTPNNKIGVKPHQPQFLIQPARQWRSTNVKSFSIALRDLAEAIG
jgi:hypothetical protein